MWQKVAKPHDTNESTHLISVEDNQIKLGLRHFCKETVSAKTPTKLKLFVFQNPSSLKNKDDAYITVYAVPESIEEVNTPINSRRKQVKCVF